MEEEWKDIAGYEGRYKVSNLGRVMSVHTLKPDYHGRVETRKRIMKPTKGGKMGYLMVHLAKAGENKAVTIHRLVAQHFLPNPYGYDIINHIDENPLNNRVDNLEWCTQSHNMSSGTVPKRHSNAMARKAGETDPAVCAFTKDGRFIARFSSTWEASQMPGVKTKSMRAVRAHIRNCCRGEYKSAYGYVWKYATGEEAIDPKITFLTRLQELLEEFDAKIDCAVCGEDTQDYPLVRFANGEILYWRGINGITASNIMDFEK